MTVSGTTVKPDKRKGMVMLQQSEDALIHFCWKDRTSGVVEEDLVIFEGDAEVKKVPQCTTGRVILLEFAGSSNRNFFWLQEPKKEKDDEYVTKLNQYMNSPPEYSAPNAGGRDTLDSIDQQQLMAMLTGTAGRNGGALNVEGIQQIMQQMGMFPPAATPGSGAQPPVRSAAAAAPASTPAPTPTPPTPSTSTALSSVLAADALIPLLDEPLIRDQIVALGEHLPEGQRTVPEIIEQLRGPQFQQMVETLGVAMQSGQAYELMRTFGIQPTAANPILGTEGLVQALQSQADSFQTPTAGSAAKADEKDDKMDES